MTVIKSALVWPDAASGLRVDALIARPGDEMEATGAHLLARDQTRFYSLSLTTAGFLERWLVKIGDPLEPGQEVALLRTDPDAHRAADLQRRLNELDAVRESAVIGVPDGLAAYVVPAGLGAPHQLPALLAELLPQALQPDAWVLLDSLPRLADGRLDLETLRGFPAPTTANLETLEAQLRTSCPSAAVVLSTAQAPKPKRLHLDDLCDTSHSMSAPSTEPRPLPPETAASRKPALSDGGPIPDDFGPRLLPQLLAQAATSGQGLVFVDGEGNEGYQSYAELMGEARNLAAALRDRPLKPGDTVILQCEARRAFLTALWGCFLAGLVPLPTAIAPSYTEKNQVSGRVYHAWTMLDQPPILTDMADKVQALAQIHNMDNPLILAMDRLEAPNRERPMPDQEETDLVLLLMTSGSTGKPKLVSHSHASLLPRGRTTTEMLGMTPAEVSLNWLPLDHVASIVDHHLRDLLLCVKAVQAPTEYVLADPLRWLELVDRHRVTATWAPNFAYALIADRAAELPPHRYDLSCMKYAINAGESIVPATARRFLEVLAGQGLRGDAMLPAWGMSETASGVTYASDFSLEQADWDAQFMNLGRPIAGFAMRVVDANQELLTEGRIGRLQIKGTAVMCGYYLAPEHNAETFTEDGWLQTGDLAKLQDGCLLLTGREKDVIIIHGLNYYCHEIESVVEEVSGVQAGFTAAVAVRSRRSGTEQLAVFCHLAVAEEGRVTATIEEIRTRVLRQVGLYPDYVLPLTREEIPKTGIGKIQRAVLRNHFRDGLYENRLKTWDLTAGNERTLPHWFLRPDWVPGVGVPRKSEREDLLLFSGRDRAYQALCTTFKRTVWVQPGDRFEKLGDDTYALDPTKGAEYAQLFEHLDTIPKTCVFLWPWEEDTNDHGLARGFVGLANAAEAAGVRDLYVVGRNAQAVDGQPPHPQQAALASLVRSADGACPRLACRHLDIPRDEALPSYLLREMQLGGQDVEVAWRKGTRLVSRLTPASLDRPRGSDRPRESDLTRESDLPRERLKPNGVYLITGALGGMGRLLARYLLERYQARLLLVGRSAVENHDPRLQVLAGLPGDVRYLAVDVACADELTAAVAPHLADWGGSLDGIFHLAGVYVDSPFSPTLDLSADMAPKYKGAVALSRLPLADDGFLMAASSVLAHLYGADGKAAYAAANRAMEAFCLRWSAETGKRAHLTAFSAWDDVGLNAGYSGQEATRALGYHMLSPQAGIQSLLAAMNREGLILVGLNQDHGRMRPLLNALPSHALLEPRGFYQATEDTEAPTPPSYRDLFGRTHSLTCLPLEQLPHHEGALDRDALARPTQREQPLSETQRRIAALFSKVLGCGRVAAGDNFFALGGHSILALQLLRLVRDSFGVSLAGPVFLAGPTVAQLAEEVDRATADDGAQAEVLPQITPNPKQRHKAFPLTDIQQAYHIGASADLELSDVSMHLYLEVVMDDPDHRRLEQALNGLIERHDMLRAVILPEGTERILPEVPPYTVPLIDLRKASAKHRDEALETLRHNLSHQRFNAEQWPGFDIRLALTGTNKGRLFISIAALHIDGGSFFLLMKEWGRRYREPGLTLSRLQLSYRDYALALRELEQSEAFAADWAYWTERLKELPEAPALPYAVELANLRNYRFSHHGFHLDQATWDKLKKVSGKLGVSRSAMGLAAYGLVLAQWSRRPNLCVNVTLFNRLPLHEQVNAIAGDFTSMVLAGLSLDAEDSFETLARRVQDGLWQDLAHRNVSGVKLLRELARQRRQGARALMPVIFTSALDLEMSGATSPHNALRQMGAIDYQMSQTPQVVLDCQLFEDDGRLLCMVDAVEAAFPEGMIAALTGAMRELLGELAEESAWKGLPRLLPPAQRAQRLQVNQTHREVPRTCLHLLFLDRAARQGDLPAVIAAERTLDYAGLAREANRVAGWLRRHGARPNKLVAVVLPKGWGQAVATLGIQIAGAAYLPIDPELPAARRAYLLENGGVSLALTDTRLQEDGAWPDGVTTLALDGARLAEESETPVPPAQNPDDLAYVIFTSGSTGKPKGVMIDHGAAANTILDINSRFDVGAEDRLFALSSLSFDLSVYDLFGAFAAGAALVVPDPGTHRDPAHWMDQLRRHRVSIWNSVPALMDILVTFAADHEAGLPQSLRAVLLSGDWIPLSLPERIRAILPQAAVISMGGATEASIWSIIFPIEHVDPAWKSIPYGKPMVNQRFHVLDDHLQPRPDFVPGELYIGGMGLARGYWADPEKTAAAFFINPHTGERLYRTGDLGRTLPDGNIEFLGREDFQVKVQGFRIELGEIETALEEQAGVARAVVVARGRRDEGKQLLAFVTGEAVVGERLKHALSQRLPDYMVPSSIVVLDELPLSPTGKIDRGALGKLGELEESGPSEGYVAPRDGLERELAALWCELLDVSRIGMYDDLMQMGTNSLTAIKAVALIRARLNVELPLRLVLSGRAHLADLAAEVKRQSEDGGDAAQLPRVVAAPEAAHAPFRFNDIQEAYWVGRLEAFELGGVAAYFYLEVALGDLDVPRLQRAWARVIDRHPMLRAVFLADGTQQVLETVPDYPIEILELGDLPEAEAQARSAAVRARMSHQVLPADRWPLFELRVSRLSDGARLHFGLDLLIADAWSVQILFSDMERFYRNPDLVEDGLQLSFRDYLHAEEQLRDTPAYQRAQAYWWARLDQLPPAPRLPMVKEFGEIEAPHFERFSTSLAPVDWRALTERAAAANLSPSGLLLAAFVEVLGYWSRNPHFTINVTTFNRLPLHPQAEHVVGDFTTLNLLEVDGQGADFSERARRVQERLWEDLEHRYVGGLTVLRELGRRRGRKPGALAPIVFTSLLDSYGRSGDFVPLDGEVVYASSQTPQVWLDYQVREQDGRLYITWDLVSELLPEGLPAQLFAAYRGLLLDLAGNDSWTTPGRNLLPKAQQILRAGVNATETPLTARLLHRLFEEQAARTPDAPAVIDETRRLTYGELQRRVNALAMVLKQRGAQPNQLIAVALEKGWQQAVATLAVLSAGAAYLPMDPKLPEARRRYLLAETRAAQVIAEASQTHWPDGVTPTAPDQGESETPVRAQVGLQDLAYVIFTSGSTGKPKGVKIEHAAAANTILDINQRFQVTAADRIFALSALSFDLSVYDLFGGFAAGAAVVFPPADAGRDPDCWHRLIHQHQVSIWNSVPALMNMAATHFQSNHLRFPDSLRLVLMSGDWIPVPLPNRIRALANDPTLISMGGATEASIWSIIFPIGEVDPKQPSIPYGKPMANQRFYVLDSRLEPRPTWVPGDLYIGGVGLARGYWGDPEKTAASFINHPLSGERLYKTGDLGRYLPDGNIEFLGREDFQVKIQGFRIELGEIESALCEHGSVQDAVVDAHGPDRENRRLVAYVVGRAESDDLRGHLQATLPEYMIPAAFVFMDNLPLTANGKVDRTALPAPDLVEAPIHEEALTPLEHELATLWATTLDRSSVAVRSDFFELGGNSLTAIRMISEVSRRFGVDLSLRDFFADATVAGLAALLARLRASSGEEHRRESALDLPELTPSPEHAHEPFALNDIQQAYWMGRQRGLELGGVAAHFYFELELQTENPERIQQAWRRLIARHDMLRVVFLPDGRQTVLREVPDFTVATQDLRGLAGEARQAALETLRENLSHQVLPTDQWPLFEIHVSRLEQGLIRAHFSFDLLLADAWSALLLFMEFGKLYHDPHAELPPIGLSYRDYMSAMARFPESPAYAAARAYWRKRLPVLPAAPRLPLKQEPSTITEPRFERRAGRLDAPIWQALQQKAAALGLTPSGLLLAVYAEVLATWSGRRAFTINVTTFNRLPIHDDIEKLVGDFTSLTLLAVDGGGNTFSSRAGRIQQQLWEDLDHRFYSGVQVIRDLASHQGRAPGALLPVVFTSRLFKASGGSPLPHNDDGSPGQVVYSVSQTPQVWLDKQVFEEEGALHWTWDSVAGLFPEDMLDAMFAAYTNLLHELAGEDRAWRQSGALVQPAVIAAVEAANNTARDLPATLLHTPFLRQVSAQPDAPAVIDGTTVLCYGELAHKACRLAAHELLAACGPEDLVGIVLDKGWNQVVAALAVVLAGAAYLPIDPKWPAERRDDILRRAGARAVLSEQALCAKADFSLPVLAVDTLTEHSPDHPVCAAEPENLAYVIFTSGSTGRPKGVAIEHRAAANTIADINERYQIGPTDRTLAVSSLAFDLSVYDLFGLLAAGGAVVIPPSGENPDPALWLNLLHEHQVTVWNSVPALMELLISHADEHGATLPASLRLVLLSGDWLPLDIAPRLRRHHPEIEVISLGGATEGSIWSIHHPVAELDPSWTSVPYGKALANQQMYVLDQDMRIRAAHVPGDIYIGGRGVARAYFGDARLSAAAYVPSPFEQGARLYKTGDLGRYLPGGDIEFLGRADFQVKVGGHRIELGEIEAGLCKHPAVKSAVAVAPWVNGQRGPGGNRRLVAYVVPELGETPPDKESLRAWLADFVPDYMVPNLFMNLAALPLTANGKVDRKALPQPEVGSAPIGAESAPATPMEARLVSVWKEVLELKNVSREDNFFDLGGNSLLALKMLTRLRELLDRPVSLQQLFDNIVLHQLARSLDRLTEEGEAGTAAERLPQLVPDPANLAEPFPLTQVQQAYWIGRMSGIQGGSVAAHAYYELESRDFDLARFSEGFRAMITRHDALRIVIDGNGRQRILQDVPAYQIQTDDLRRLDEATVDRKLEHTRERMSHQVLSTEEWPIFEVRASLLTPNITRLHLSFDLLIADAWSSQVLFHELGLYLQGKGAQLQPLTCSFRDYVLAEEASRNSERYARARTYWLDRLDTLPPAPELPTLKQAEGDGTLVFARRADLLDAAVWQGLKDRAAARGLTPSGFLLSAFCEVLARWSASPRFTLNLTTFNRMPLHPQVDNLMGDFTSLTLLAVDGTKGHTFAERARFTQEQLWQDLDHRHMNGVEVMREMVRAKGGGMQARAPIVFTSRLFSGNRFMAAEEQGALFGEVVYSVSQTPQVWLDHQVVEEDGGLAWTWDVVEGLFPTEMIDEMFAVYGELLRRLAQDKTLWGEPAPLARPLEAVVYETWSPALLHQPFFEQAERTPLAPAVYAPDGVIDYATLARYSRRLARLLCEKGAATNELVAIVMEKGWQQAVAALAVVAAGAAYQPIDAHLPPERIRRLLERGGTRLVLCQGHLADQPAQLMLAEAGYLCLDVDAVCADESRDDSAFHPAIAPDHLAYVIFTSGSTGMPKGVAVEHGAAANTVRDINTRFKVGARDRVLALSSLSFDLSVYDLFGPLAVGGALVLPAPGTERDPAHWARLLHKHQITLWNSVPALMDMMVEAAANSDGAYTLPACLRLVMMSGDWIPVSLPDRIRAQVPDSTVISMGGATEASIWSIIYEIGEVDPDWPSIPYGYALRGQSFHVLDHQLNPCPTYVPGELYIGGVGLARAYWGDEEKTAAAFITHPHTGQRLYRTGDHGRLLPGENGATGPIEFLGRRDLQVKILGHRVELGEIEAALNDHPEIAAAVVNAPYVQDQLAGSGRHRRLVGYVVPQLLETKAPAAVTPRVHNVLELPRPERAEAQGETVEALGLHHLRDLLATLANYHHEGLPLPKYRYASAGSLYPVQVYLTLKEGAVDGVAAGAYVFHPGERRLLRLLDGARLPADGPPLALHLVARLSAVGPIYPKWAWDFCLLEAGYMRNLLRRQAQRDGYTLFPSGGTVLTTLRDALGLEAADTWCCSLAGEPDDGERPAKPAPTDWSAHHIEDHIQRLTFKLSQPGLPKPAKVLGTVPLETPDDAAARHDLFARRRSARAYLQEPISLQRFGDWLCQLGQTHLELYLCLGEGKVTGLSAGAWRYDSTNHRLELLNPGAEIPREDHVLINRPIHDSAGFMLFMVARNSPSVRDEDLLEAGELGQILQDDGHAHRLAVCALGVMDRYDSIRAMFGLDRHDQLLQNFIGGAVAARSTTLTEAYQEQQTVIRKMVAEMPPQERENAAGADMENGTTNPLPQHTLHDDKLKRYLADRLPHYMVPGLWMYLNRLPLTANGKVDRKALPLPESRADTTRTGGKPSDELEQTIADLVAQILQEPQIGTTDNFFELGANSLQLVQLQGRLQASLKQTIAITTIFGNPTVVALAGALRGNDEDALAEGRERARKRRQRGGAARKRKERNR